MVYFDRGYIGCFDMDDKDSGVEQLSAYVEELKNAGHKRIVGPINGDTWHSYRLVSWCSGDAAFPMEPQNPLWYNEVYADCGFVLVKKYHTDKFSLVNIEAPQNTNLALVLRPFKPDDLPLIYDLSLNGFDENFLYNAISYDDFAALYTPMLPMIDPELMLIAELDGWPAGFLFSFVAEERLILKSMATLPQCRGYGVGSLLMAQVLATGRAKGLKTAVAALMSDDNVSRHIVSKYGSEQIREYTVYALEV